MEKMLRVMVCVDLSDFTRETIESALLLDKERKAEILLFNVINSRDIVALEEVSCDFPGKINKNRFIERSKEERNKKIQELIENHFQSHKDQFNIVFRVGIPYREILDAIETEDIDLVVLANKGKSNLIGTLHGSNAEKVFRHSPVPVLSVRNREVFTKNRLQRNRLQEG